MPTLRVALAQTNPTVADIDTNVAQIIDAARSAVASGADLLLTGELAVTGYPVEDLALRDDFLERSSQAPSDLAQSLESSGLGNLIVVVGHPAGPVEPGPLAVGNLHPARARNQLSVLQHGVVHGAYAKRHLPNYGVFDEFRTFVPGDSTLILQVNGVDCGLLICEDLWRDEGPVDDLRRLGVGAVLVANASPFERDKDDLRIPLVTRRAHEWGAPVVYVNLVGGQDDLVFDGDSVVVTARGELVTRLPQFTPHLSVLDLDVEASVNEELPPGVSRLVLTTPATSRPPLDPPAVNTPTDDLQVLWMALVTGLRDYVVKNGFPGVLLGLSGGIDSAVCATLAVDALGPEAVTGISLPSRYSSEHSLDDARLLAENLGIHYRVEPISDIVSVLDNQLGLSGLAAENSQARTRGMILMSVSNMEGQLVLTTGNKSELAVGYSTIYGDSVGGFAPIKDVPKTLVWDLARWRNQHAHERGETPPIPVNSIEKPPSAELRPGQVDQDSLPDYAVLDAILDLLIVRGLDAPQIVARGYDQETVSRIVSLVDRAEWKRRQGAIGPRISSVAFGRDRRFPISHRKPAQSPRLG